MYSIEYEEKCIRQVLERPSAHVFDMNSLIQIAFHDSLTGLPNRFLFHEQFSSAIKNAKRKKQKLAIMFIDLDNFKKINDIYGHQVGDQALLKVAGLLKDTVRETDIIARFGGDEFLFVGEISSIDDLIELTQRLLSSLKCKITPNLVISPSIGIAVYPDHGKDIASLLDRADKALYQAKKGKKHNLKIYDKTY